MLDGIAALRTANHFFEQGDKTEWPSTLPRLPYKQTLGYCAGIAQGIVPDARGTLRSPEAACCVMFNLARCACAPQASHTNRFGERGVVFQTNTLFSNADAGLNKLYTTNIHKEALRVPCDPAFAIHALKQNPPAEPKQNPITQDIFSSKSEGFGYSRVHMIMKHTEHRVVIDRSSSTARMEGRPLRILM